LFIRKQDEGDFVLGKRRVVNVFASIVYKSFLTTNVVRSRAVFLKLWSADHKWSSGSALVVLLD